MRITAQVLLPAAILLSGCGDAVSPNPARELEIADRPRTVAHQPQIPLSGLTFRNLGNTHVFEDPSTPGYNLQIFDHSSPAHPFPIFGQFIYFDEHQFRAYNSTQCGNDVFIETRGTYRWTGKQQIEVFVQSIQRNEYCDRPSENPDRSYGTFTVEKSGKNSFRLTRTDEGTGEK